MTLHGHEVSTPTLVMVQDDSRERAMRELFGLVEYGGRACIDATDEAARLYELKSTSKASVSTARDLGPKHLTKWRECYWIMARGINTTSGFKFNEYYFLAPVHMAAWFNKIATKFAVDMELLDFTMTCLPADTLPWRAARIAALLSRGMLLNDPKLPWSYIKTHGIRIGSNHAQRLREIADQFPIGDASTPVAVIAEIQRGSPVTPSRRGLARRAARPFRLSNPNPPVNHTHVSSIRRSNRSNLRSGTDQAVLVKLSRRIHVAVPSQQC